MSRELAQGRRPRRRKNFGSYLRNKRLAGYLDAVTVLTPNRHGYCGVAIAIGCVARDNLKSWPRGRTRADVTGSTSSAERFGHNMVSEKPIARDSNMPTAHLIHG